MPPQGQSKVQGSDRLYYILYRVLASQRVLSSSNGLPHLETGGVLGSLGSVIISDLGILSLVFLNNFNIFASVNHDLDRAQYIRYFQHNTQ